MGGTGLSGKAWLLIAAACFALLACAGCGGGADVVAIGTAHATEPTLSAPKSVTAGIIKGAPIVASQATARLPMMRGADVLQPVAAFEGSILVSVSPQADTAATVQRFELWDPVRDSFSKVWSGEPGTQDIVGGVDGDWAATVRTGMELPFADWAVILRDLRTGESRTIAKSDPTVASDTHLAPDLPLGLAPLPSISGDTVVWDEYRPSGSGTEKRVQVYDIRKASARTIASVPDAGSADLRLPVVLGDTAAWVRRDLKAGTADIEVHDLASDSDRMLGVGGNPWQVALLDGGRSVAWDDNLQTKYVRTIAPGAPLAFAGTEGWGVQSNGSVLTWTPAGAQGGTGGFFDPATKTIRLLPKKQAVRTNIATVLGPWFAWQELTPSQGGSSAGDANYYFLRLPTD